MVSALLWLMFPFVNWLCENFCWGGGGLGQALTCVGELVELLERARITLHNVVFLSPHRRRSTEPVCAGLQSEILKCYQANKHEVLKCSELAKEYQRCVSAARKVTVTPSPPHPTGLIAWRFLVGRFSPICCGL